MWSKLLNSGVEGVFDMSQILNCLFRALFYLLIQVNKVRDRVNINPIAQTAQDCERLFTPARELPQ
jgi:hypothetical protein